MQAYKFETTVLENGIFNLPQLKELANHKVEIIIIDTGTKGTTNNKNHITAKTFLKKWTGFLGKEQDEDLKLNYLEEKYK